MKFKLLSILLLSVVFSCGIKKNQNPVVPAKTVDYKYIEKFHEALRLQHKGQLLQAISIFESCALMHPEDDAVYYALSELYLQTNQLPKSSEVILKAVNLDPKNKWYIQEYAYMLFESGNFKEAAKQFKKLTELEPKNIDWLFSYAESLMRSGDINGALKIMDKLEDQLGRSPELSLEKFKMYRKIKQDDKALQEINKALEEFPSDAQLLANLVDYYFEKKEDDKAFTFLMKLAESDPGNGNAHLALAQYYDHKGNNKESYNELRKAFVCDDIQLDLKVKIILSMFDSQFKLDPEMFELANILVAEYPLEARVYTVRGDFYLKEQHEKEALVDFKEALKYDKTKYAIWEQVLLMEYQNQNFQALYDDSKSCLEFFPAVSKVYLFNGISAIQLKKYQEALDKLSAGEELISNDPVMKGEFWAQKGDACFSLKKYKEGSENYEKAIKADPANSLYKNNYAYRLGLANIELDKAESLIKQVLVDSPEAAHFLDTYGWILFQKGEYAKALEQFQKALAASSQDKHIIEHNGDALFKLGKVSEAMLSWKKALDLGSTNLKLHEKIEKKMYYDPEY